MRLSNLILYMLSAGGMKVFSCNKLILRDSGTLVIMQKKLEKERGVEKRVLSCPPY